MNKKGIIQVCILLLVVLGGDLILIALGITGKAITYLTVPPLYAITYFAIGISRLTYKNYLDGILLFFCTALVLILPFKVTYSYYNIYFFIFITILGIWFLKSYYSKFNSSKYRTVAVLLVVVNAVVIVLPDSVIFSHLNWQRVMWTPNLKWKDFRGEPFGEEHYGAHLRSNLRWRANRVYSYPAGTVIAYMEPDSSYKKELPSHLAPELRDSLVRELLKHEQIHFDIAEYYARLANERIASQWFLSETEVETIFNKVFAEYVKEETEYDSVTKHSTDIEQQAKWTEKYQQRLNIK